ncbi:WAP four-disulfide core domain protein 13 [Lemur catta]|uniref:WAP four-disulfide core domain protein 13 n=1 Tax=Lemur catta TaxID=9447 RepID=UPI001E26B516|nr:WAP four-disulfide core domain protein 13 [Lemur catta]XP_045384036.1 WAP four-disulfide core domain protein 13 [Lemur catta]XP_045384037.1 WAP four-disulfide core domain protein 13 [Lemur catta]
MKLVLPLLLLVLGLALQPVPGRFKHRFQKYILEPPPCRSEPENCTYLCNLQEECKEGLQCCSSFCGIVCSSNKFQKLKKIKPQGSGTTPDN